MTEGLRNNTGLRNYVGPVLNVAHRTQGSPFVLDNSDGQLALSFDILPLVLSRRPPFRSVLR